MLGLIPPKDWLYLGAIVALITGFLFYRHSLIVDGEQICQRREKAAADKQAVADTKISQDTIDALHLEIARLSSANSPRVSDRPVRVQCYARPVPAPKSQPGTARAGEPASPGGSVPAVPAGARAGSDIDPKLRRVALAADLVSARDRACLKELTEP